MASVSTKRGGLRRVSGRPAALGAEAGKRGRRGIEGIALSREIFVKRQAIAHPRPTAALTRAVRHEFDSAIGPSSRHAAVRTGEIRSHPVPRPAIAEVIVYKGRNTSPTEAESRRINAPAAGLSPGLANKGCPAVRTHRLRWRTARRNTMMAPSA